MAESDLPGHGRQRDRCQSGRQFDGNLALLSSSFDLTSARTLRAFSFVAVTERSKLDLSMSYIPWVAKSRAV